MTWREEPRVQKTKLKAVKNHFQALSLKQENPNLFISLQVFKQRTELGLLYLRLVYNSASLT